MWEFVCHSLICIFAIYGFLEFGKIILYTFVKIKQPRFCENGGIHIILEVKNAEKDIESFLRIFLFKILNYAVSENTNVTIKDLNSTDNTVKILKKLNDEYNFEFIQEKEINDN